MRWSLVWTAMAVVLAAGAAGAGPNPDVNLAMHLIACDGYLTCDDFQLSGQEAFNADLTMADLAAGGYAGYVVFVAYDLGSCISCIEYFVQGWPMGRGAPVFSGPDYCAPDYAMTMGEPFEALGGGGLSLIHI